MEDSQSGHSRRGQLAVPLAIGGVYLEAGEQTAAGEIAVDKEASVSRLIVMQNAAPPNISRRPDTRDRPCPSETRRPAPITEWVGAAQGEERDEGGGAEVEPADVWYLNRNEGRKRLLGEIVKSLIRYAHLLNGERRRLVRNGN